VTIAVVWIAGCSWSEGHAAGMPPPGRPRWCPEHPLSCLCRWAVVCLQVLLHWEAPSCRALTQRCDSPCLFCRCSVPSLWL